MFREILSVGLKITGEKVGGMLGERIPPYAKIKLTIGDRWQSVVQKANKKYLPKDIELLELHETNSQVLSVTLPVLSHIKNACEQICSLQMNGKSWRDSQGKVSVNCFYRFRHPSYYKIYFYFSLYRCRDIFPFTPLGLLAWFTVTSTSKVTFQEALKGK